MNKEDARVMYDWLDTCDPPISFQRGYLNQEQLDFSSLDMPGSFQVDGHDIRNYCPQFLDGLPEARKMFSRYLGVKQDEVIIYAQTARRVIHDVLLRAYGKDVPGASVLCPVPGYDNHHRICEDIGLSMIPIPMRADGPDMDIVEDKVWSSVVKSIICVPRYHNPTGITYSPNVVRRLAHMKAPSDFRIIWDCAYLKCHFTRFPDRLLNIMDECREAGNPDRPLIVFSTSKITAPGYSIAGVAGSERNMDWIRKLVKVTSSNTGLVNQLQHVNFLKSAGGIGPFMRNTHGSFLGNKMELVDDAFMSEFGQSDTGVVWRKPEGGYSFCVQLQKPCALRVVELAAAKGVLLHDPRDMYPYGHDPDNKYLRIMPSAVADECITAGMWVVSKSIQLALAECD